MNMRNNVRRVHRQLGTNYTKNNCCQGDFRLRSYDDVRVSLHTRYTHASCYEFRSRRTYCRIYL
jgi:hypothetical protein